MALTAGAGSACSAGDEGADGHLDDRSVASASNVGPVVVELVDHDVVDGTVEVPVGESVRWDNRDSSAHELVSLTGDVIRSPVLSQAASYTARFEAPGEYPYYCNIHNYMKGTVVVR